jgi:starch synthase
VGRLAEQKGIRDLVSLIRIIQDAPINIVILGSGDEEYESLCKTLHRHNNVRVMLKYDEELSRRIYAASDFFLMPSRFEPCGLAQMIAMRYGAIPIVRRTGGLKDTVVDFSDPGISGISEYAGIGITMKRCDSVSFMHAIIKALSLYASEEMMREIIVYNMNKDFSWHRPAMAYLALYHTLNS